MQLLRRQIVVELLEATNNRGANIVNIMVLMFVGGSGQFFSGVERGESVE